MLPSQYVEVQSYPSLKRFLEAQVDMQFSDLRTMLRLPIPQVGLEAGCNFATASILFNVISGTSVCFYEASEAAFKEPKGDRFKNVLKSFYPWQDEPLSKDEGVLILYKEARNPLAHSLGLDTPPKDSDGKQISIDKKPLILSQIDEIEEAIIRPKWLSPTVNRQQLSCGSVEFKISVPTLYWGIHRMLHKLFSDANQATQADALVKLFSLQWDKITTDEGHATETAKLQKI